MQTNKEEPEYFMALKLSFLPSFGHNSEDF